MALTSARAMGSRRVQRTRRYPAAAAALFALLAFPAAAAPVAAAAAAAPAAPAPACPAAITDSLTSLGLTPVPQALQQQEPWAQQRLAPERAWPLTRGAGVTVAVIDSGVDAHAPGLAGPGKVLPGVDELGGPDARVDCVGHGTLVAGIIAASAVPGTRFAGVAPDAAVLPVRQSVGQADPDGVAHLTRAVRDAVARHVAVINISITLAAPDPDLARAIADAEAHDIVVVAAAGNDQTQGNAPEYPAAFPGVLAVGAVDQTGARADFSETGTQVSVVAPGVAVTGPGAGVGELVTGARGTSFSAPFVAGVAALVRAYRPQLTAAQVVRRIEATADRVAGAVPDPRYGWGVVDPYAAVTAVLPGESGPVAAPASDEPPVTLPASAPPPDRSRGRAAVLVGVVAGGLAAMVAAALWAWPAGRARGWRAGRWGF